MKTAAGTQARAGAAGPYRRCPVARRAAAAFKYLTRARIRQDRMRAARHRLRVSRLHLGTLRRDGTPSGRTQRPMHARPDANNICRNIDMHASAEIARMTGPAAGATRAVAFTAPSRHRAPVAPPARRSGAPRFPAFPT
ncbi:hypothetical protein [Burkholderia sp. SCN-KJ]|uniref:hypothetical protein n=1 Tax=Burkholderia sp. SCN-KJ TaxID=2969248 RepID=UPI00214F9BCB|nr:hypothetical protein [Burkholderia sp. SCN-KJ]MCR4471201.1 hypothetical protein [Burkholderia sp. SCN-KJ]